MLTTVFDAVQSPPCEFGRISVFEKIFNKKFYEKKFCLRTYFEPNLLFFCFFLFKYDEIIIKQPSSNTFDMKVVKF